MSETAIGELNTWGRGDKNVVRVTVRRVTDHKKGSDTNKTPDFCTLLCTVAQTNVSRTAGFSGTDVTLLYLVFVYCVIV